MRLYTEEFLNNHAPFDLDTLHNQPQSTFALNADLEIMYVNHAWIQFAKENGASNFIFSEELLGQSILNVIADPLQVFFETLYGNVLNTGNTDSYEYECHSHKVFRLMHQTIYPLAENKGILAVNSIQKEVNMAEVRPAVTVVSEDDYRFPDGTICQCAHCRRTSRADGTEIWDWVPKWVEKMPSLTSHGLCRTCFEYHYSDK